MPKENNKIVIVVGAGASADFQPENFRFPSGEALIKMIGNKEKITKIFWNEICESFRNVVFEKLKTTDQSMINLHNIFCNFLINQDHSKNNQISITKLSLFQITSEFANHLGKKFSELKNIINFCYHENNVNRTSVENNLYHIYKDINANEEDLFDNEKNDKKECKFYKIIFAISNSRYLQISRLVKYYQPFSIDELLDSIKREKNDVLKPLKIKKEDLKTILKSDEQDQKKLEEQFRNELIDAGKTLIALFLLGSEKKDLFDNFNPEINTKIWYRHIRNLIINSGNNQKEIKEKLKNLVIISFNYDRSLEFYLRSRLPEYFYEINILYPYGKLGDNSFVADRYCEFNDDVKTKPIITPVLEEIEKIAEQIQVIGEKNLIDNIDENNNLIFDNCKKWFKARKKDFKLENAHPSSLNPDVIKNIIYLSSEIDLIYDKNIQTFNELTKQAFYILSANKIYFLGFAFHKPNIELLCLDKIKEWHDGKKIYYTNFDNSLDIENKVSNLFSGDLFIKIPSIKKGVYDALIHDFKLEFE